MKKLLVSAVAASSLVACTSVETAVVSGTEIASATGEPIAVIQANAIGLTAIFHIIDLVQSDLDMVINRLLVAEAKAMGGQKVQILSAHTTPRHGLYALLTSPPWIIGVTESSVVGVAVKAAK